MVNILDESRGNLLALTIEGKISDKDFDVLNPILEKTIDEHDDPRAYIELKEIDGVTFKAILEDLSNIPKYNKFKKVAVVGDANWKEMITKVLGTIVSPTSKYFEFDEKIEAMEWVKN